MRRKTVLWLIAATVLILLGGLLFVTVMTANSWDFTALNTKELQTNEYEITEAVEELVIDTNTTDVEILPSTDGKCRVVCVEWEKETHEVSVVDGRLLVTFKDNRRWFEHIELFSIGSSKITVYLPEGALKSVSVTTDTGDVTLKERTVGALTLSATTGDITLTSITCAGDVSLRVTTGKTELSDVMCRALTAVGSTGDITLHNVAVGERLSVERGTGDVTLSCTVAAEMAILTDTGDVTLSLADAAKLEIVTDTGDVEGTLGTGKVFTANSDTGHVSVPQNAEGGTCEITTDTGDIHIQIAS